MIDSPVVEVLLALILLFFVLSSACSAIVEGVGTLLNRRGKTLWDAVGRLISDPGGAANSVRSKLYETPFIRQVAAVNPPMTSSNKPVNIPGRTFAEATLNVIKPNGQFDTDLSAWRATIDSERQLSKSFKATLLQLIDQTQGDVNDVRAEIEGWYDRQMEGLSRWYQRRTRWWLFLAGLVMAVTLNIDAIQVGRTLWNDDDLRASVIEVIDSTECAPATGTDGADPTPEQIEAARKACTDALTKGVEAVNLPIGWQCPEAADDEDGLRRCGVWEQPVEEVLTPSDDWVGWLITAAAISMGAPFWYDALGMGRVLRKRREADAAASA